MRPTLRRSRRNDTRGVSSLALRVAVELAAKQGVGASHLLRGSGVRPEDLRNPLKRFAWGTYARVLDRMQDAVGGEDFIFAATQQMPSTLPEVASFAGGFVTPLALARFLFLVADPVVYPMVVFELRELGEDRVELRGTLKKGFRGSRTFFVGSAGAAVTFPQHLGLPNAQMEELELSERDLRMVLRLPPSRTLMRRARGAVRRLERVLPFVAAGSVDQPGVTAKERREIEISRRLERAVVQWNLSPRQTDVLQQLVAGRDNQQIAQELGCAVKTVETHVTALLERAEASSRLAVVAAFWSDLG